jgi:uncharacterized protein (DUF1810 family)
MAFAMRHDLDRFVNAQAECYAQVLNELAHGRKTGHWMWYVFPQAKGLGNSHTASIYAISSIEEAMAYLVHPVLGPRLRECTTLVNQVGGRTLDEIFGFPDRLKFQSCMTLFSQATTDNAIFLAALARYCDGHLDRQTLKLLRGE